MMDHAIQNELRREENLRLYIKIDRLQSAGDGLAEEIINKLLSNFKIQARYAKHPHEQYLASQQVEELTQLLTNWEQSKQG